MPLPLQGILSQQSQQQGGLTGMLDPQVAALLRAWYQQQGSMHGINGAIVQNQNPVQFPPQSNGIMSILLGHRG